MSDAEILKKCGHGALGLARALESADNEHPAASDKRCCDRPLSGNMLEATRHIYAALLAAPHGRDGKENTIIALFATIDADRERIAELERGRQRLLALCDECANDDEPIIKPGEIRAAFEEHSK